MLAQKASGVYLAENFPIVERPLLRSDGVAVSETAGVTVTVVGLTKVRPLTRVPAVGNGDGKLFKEFKVGVNNIVNNASIIFKLLNLVSIT